MKLNAEQKQIVAHLLNSIKKGKKYFKAKYIADETGLTAKVVGTNMAILSVISKDPVIKKWSYSNSTTWYVTSKVVRT